MNHHAHSQVNFLAKKKNKKRAQSHQFNFSTVQINGKDFDLRKINPTNLGTLTKTKAQLFYIFTLSVWSAFF